MPKINILHLVYEESSNENHLSYNPRVAFRDLIAEGLIAKVSHFPYYADYLQHHNSEVTLQKIYNIILEEKPNVLFWQHINEFPINDRFFLELQELSFKPIIVYHEGDPFGRLFKRFTPSMKCILRNADLVFWEGLGDLRKLAVKHGAKKIFLAPSNFDTDRFGGDWIPTEKRKYDVIAIGSLAKTRIPFVYLPGGRRRKKTIYELDKTFGKRLALYGTGWEKLKSHCGMLPFKDQQNAIRQGWVSVNWDHFDNLNYYNSNRLPISLAAGVPHITSYHHGFEHLYKDINKGLYFAHSPSEVIDIACYLLSKPKEELIDEGIEASRLALKYFSSTVIYRNILLKIIENMG